MTENECRQKVVDTIRGWIGRKEADGSHKYIIDIYNRQSKLPRGYKVQYSDQWCATTVSAAYFACGLVDAIVPECSCFYMVDGFKKMGHWIENDSYEPKPGDIVIYSYSGEKADYKNTDNVGIPEHTGIVEKYTDGIITVIEGNYSDAVGRRYVEKNGRYIRGFCIPDFGNSAEESKTPAKEPIVKEKVEIQGITVTLPVLSYGSVCKTVAALQAMLNGYGFNCGEVDGEFGSKTLKALQEYQKARGLDVSGKTDAVTWSALHYG